MQWDAAVLTGLGGQSGLVAGCECDTDLVQGGTLVAQVAAARAAYDRSVAAYRQTVLTAFQQVEDALSDRRILEQQAAAQAIAVA